MVHKLKRNNAYQQPSKTPSSFLFSLSWNGLTPVKSERHATKLLWRQSSEKKSADALIISLKFTKFTNEIENWEILKTLPYYKTHFDQLAKV